MNKEQFLIDLKAVHNHYKELWNKAIRTGDQILEADYRGTMSTLTALIKEIELGKYNCDYKILMSNK